MASNKLQSKIKIPRTI